MFTYEELCLLHSVIRDNMKCFDYFSFEYDFRELKVVDEKILKLMEEKKNEGISKKIQKGIR